MYRSLLYKLAIIFGVFFGVIVNSKAQSTSNKGTDFWLTYNGHIDGLNSRMTLFLTSDVNTSYAVKANGITISSGYITANVVTPVFINPNVFNVYVGSSDVKEINKGINVNSDKPISVYSVISNNARTGSTLILPTATLEREYYVFSYQNQTPNASSFSQFSIVGVKDHTEIEITPSQNNRNNTKFANVPFTITLNKGDVYQYQSANDLTGSKLKTVAGCSPFAVFSGATWSAFCESSNITANGGDNLYQQLFPVTAWGKNFVSAPFYNTVNGNTDVVRIIVAENNTTITVNGSTTFANGTSLNNPYSKGSVITFFSKTANIIKANLPISVAQYQTSQTCNPNNNNGVTGNVAYPGDPEMTILNPIEQTLKDITVYSRLNSVPGVNTNISRYYLNVIIKTADISNFTLDGNSVSNQFVPIENSDYSYAILNVTSSSDQHRLKASAGFSAIAYGYGAVESYAYLAGTDLKNLKSNLQFFRLGDASGNAETSFCIGSDFDVQLQLPYITNKITWNLNDGAYTELIAEPTYTTKVIDGEMFYIYKYKVPAANLIASGSYNFKAIVSKPINAECASEDEEIFTSFNVFEPKFNVPPYACLNSKVEFQDSSPTNGVRVISYLWDFGDGTTSTLQNPIHRFTTLGVKTVKMSMKTDIVGCELTAIRTIEVVETPVSKFSTIGKLCVNQPVTFNEESISSNIAPKIKYNWDFGDGNQSDLKAPIHTFVAAGVYQVKLITQSLAGCTDTLIKPITINELPEVSFKDPGSCVDDQVQFEATAIKGNIIAWFWDFGDGSNDLIENVKQSPKHKFTQAGTYNVSVTGKTSSGCTHTYNAQVTINGSNPTVGFSVLENDKLCANRPVSFKNTSKVSFGKIIKIEWIFDYKIGGENLRVVDTSPTDDKIYTHNYPITKIDTKYKVVQIAYSGQGCFTESAPIEIIVHAAPSIKFDNMPPICEQSGPLQLNAIEENGVLGNYVYSGNGVSATGLFNPKTAGVGKTTIKYKYTSIYGCTEEKQIDITVDAFPELTIDRSFDLLLGGEKQILATAVGTKLKYKWSPSDGLSSDTILNPIIKAKTTTTYTLTITSESCTSTISILVNVHENPNIPNVFSPNGDGKNDTWAIKYLETFVNGTVTIFNRYGQKVFTSAQYNTPWDGKYNGSDVPVGVYYYIIEPNNGRKKYTGSVTLLR